MIRVCLGIAVFGVKLSIFRYNARRTYAGQGRHLGVGRHRMAAA